MANVSLDRVVVLQVNATQYLLEFALIDAEQGMEDVRRALFTGQFDGEQYPLLSHVSVAPPPGVEPDPVAPLPPLDGPSSKPFINTPGGIAVVTVAALAFVGSVGAGGAVWVRYRSKVR